MIIESRIWSDSQLLADTNRHPVRHHTGRAQHIVSTATSAELNLTDIWAAASAPDVTAGPRRIQKSVGRQPAPATHHSPTTAYGRRTPRNVMPHSTPQPHNKIVGNLPRPAKPDYSNVFIEPVYANSFSEVDLEDDLDVPATSPIDY
ncbi:hypothetical protein [Streptomyces inhibens]|uniref:hypothetical protein n=1 Tax=Streptomyces inhibens TaxID=2293571 RepID=UPI001EE71B69|nr:hypothetical protein [Streptomyces inhibens]UKY54551.1 hypothetical protein KI385_40935 [Streptomyces inhibens]